MPAELIRTGKTPDGVAMLGRVDAQLAVVAATSRTVTLNAYRQHAPGRVSGGVTTRRNKTTGHVVVVTVGKAPLGGKVNGRDVGTQATAYWTNFGTGLHGPHRREIRLKKPVRLPNGRWVREVPGQRAQGWIAEARRQADAAAHVLVEQHLDDEIADVVSRYLR